MIQNIRNIAIIAHVDHGKTTLIDKLLVQAGALQRGEEDGERLMDSNDIEKERGITILAKNTALEWHDHRINHPAAETVSESGQKYYGWQPQTTSNHEPER